MLTDEIHETSNGTICCPTSTPDSFLELSVSGVSVLRRYLQPSGDPHGDGSWVVVPARDARSYFNWPQLREWFQKHGFNDTMLREQEEAERQAKDAWKKGLKR